jgi:hypothetical protein
MPKPLLTKRTIDDIDIFFAPDDVPSNYLELSVFRDVDVSMYLGNKEYNAIIDINAKEHGLKGKAILCAHGGDRNGNWMFYDSKNLYRVQTWINKYDGAYSALMLYCCNPGHLEVKSKRSVLLLPNADYNRGLHRMGKVQVELFVPGYGYMDSYDFEAYIIEHSLKV